MLTILVTCEVEEILYQIAQMPKTLHKWPKNVHLSPKCANAQKFNKFPEHCSNGRNMYTCPQKLQSGGLYADAG